MFFLERDVASKATNESHISEMSTKIIIYTELKLCSKDIVHVTSTLVRVSYVFRTLYVLHNFSIGISLFSNMSARSVIFT